MLRRKRRLNAPESSPRNLRAMRHKELKRKITLDQGSLLKPDSV
jgi:hypothetical protein